MLEFPAVRAAWQTYQPMHSQYANFGKFKLNSLNLFFFAKPCTPIEFNKMTCIFLSSMNEVRGYSRAAHQQELGFPITGGGWPEGKSTKEVSKDGVTFEVFTPLPIGLVLHCLVALDGDAGDFFVGGRL